MREAALYEKLPGGAVRCLVCQWRCVIKPGKAGVCGVRRNRDGILEDLVYGLASSIAPDPIEKKPLFHFHPGTLVFSLGTWGCNFRCRHCQNWTISQTLPRGEGIRISPEASVELARRYGCQGIAWTYNEPTVWFEYTLEGAKLAKKEGLYTVYVTNGFLSEEALDLLGPYLDALSLDVKGFSDRFYMELAKVSRWRKVLEIAERAKRKWGMHVEIVTNVIPTMNDDEEQLRGIARWIRESLGPETPWHITRFYPHHLMRYLPPTPISTLERAYRIGKEEGLYFVYTGNLPGHPAESTFCPKCGKLVIQRFGYEIKILSLEDGRCAGCGADLNIRR